ncbi:hypothetical protein CRT22_20905, partial [Escherichia sp. E5028]|uniref:hypothetical protein n=1 Tax=Escherichia sp. E5028 TaxID=2044602 RepID=UPI0011037DBB
MRCAYQAYKVVQCIEFTSFGRPDKAFTPHPASEHRCLMRCAYQAYKVVQHIEFTSFGRADKAFTP